VQKFWKSVKIWQSYREFTGGPFFETQCTNRCAYLSVEVTSPTLIAVHRWTSVWEELVWDIYITLLLCQQELTFTQTPAIIHLYLCYIFYTQVSKPHQNIVLSHTYLIQLPRIHKHYCAIKVRIKEWKMAYRQSSEGYLWAQQQTRLKTWKNVHADDVY